jgi:class 3 adenylate cyclase
MKRRFRVRPLRSRPAPRQQAERRLAAILAADDVAGYSRLMGADEEGTHERLKAHLRQLIDPKIEEHRGHIVKNTGDGMLAEFASVVDAVRCAAEVQRRMIDREHEIADERSEISTIIKDGRVVDREAGGFRQLPGELPRARASISG